MRIPAFFFKVFAIDLRGLVIHILVKTYCKMYN